MSLAPKGKGKKAAKALYKEEDIDMPSLVSQAMDKLAEGEWADSKAQEKKDSDRLIAIQNKREANYQMQQRKKREAAAKKEEVEIDELTKAEYDSGGLVRQHLDRKQASGISRETENRIAHNKRVQMRKRLEKRDKKEEVTHFGDILRQAIKEAKKVNAIDTINKIVKTKTMGKLHGQQVDLFTASAIQSVYKALNKRIKRR